MRISLIAAVASNRVIGKDGEIPWHYPEDLKHYKETTIGHPIIMGRRTFESFPDPLPNRYHIVLTQQEELTHSSDDVVYVNTVGEALEEADENEDDVSYVIGGQEIYDLFFDQADELVLTEIHAEHDGDTYFPDFDRVEWTITRTKPYEEFTIRWYSRES